MRYRGTDDVQVRYGHFSESLRLQSGPEDRVIPYKGERERERKRERAKERESERERERERDTHTERG